VPGAICDNPRNLSDEMLVALKENGGVIQLCILSAYIKTPEPNPERDSARQSVRTKHGDYYGLDEKGKEAFLEDWYRVDEDFPPKLATVKDAVDHIDHIVELIGVDHVGIGTDFDGGGGLEDCFDVSQMGNITLELVRRGYSAGDIRKIWGGNLTRVLEEVEAIKTDASKSLAENAEIFLEKMSRIKMSQKKGCPRKAPLCTQSIHYLLKLLFC